MQKDGREMLEPDFGAIEAHGPTPTEIDVVFLDDNPFAGAYQMWSATELLCTGDGVTARRVFKLAANDAEKALAEQIREQSKGREKYFPDHRRVRYERLQLPRRSGEGEPGIPEPL
jgi:hypothetical protein